MSNKTNVIKRNGDIQSLDLNKLHLMVEEACKDLSGVSPSQVEMTSGIQLYDGISTAEIQEILIKSASDLISLDHPNYQFVAARLLLFSIRKSLYGRRKELPSLLEHVQKVIELGFYDPEILNWYSEQEFEELNSYLDHDRDFLFTYAGIREIVDKYLVQDRSTKKVFETPQFMYMLVSMVTFSRYPKETRMSYVKRYYDIISKHKINIPTPIMAGVRTNKKQYASCTLLDCGDSLESIIATKSALMRYVSAKSGIGLNVGRIRGLGSKIRNGEVVHTGIVPFIKSFEGDLNSCSQGGLRKGSATLFFPIWHQEIRELIVLKNEKGNDENRARSLDYAVSISKLFYERFIKNEEVTLFSPHDVPGLYDAFGTDGFDDLYVRYEQDESIPKQTVNAQELILEILNERSDTGRVYILNIDHANSHGPYLDAVHMSNLCVAGDTKIDIEVFVTDIEEYKNIVIDIKDLSGFIDNPEYTDVKVLSYDIETGEKKFAPIVAFAQTSPKEKVMRIKTNEFNTELILTPDHKVFTLNRGYVMAKDLKVTDKLVYTGETHTVESLLTIEYLEEEIPVYDITVEGTHNFFANNILVSNCMEILLRTKPIEHIEDVDGAIALCILSAVNAGTIKTEKELEECCDLAVRALDELIDIQEYPVKAAEIATKKYRPLGIGIIGLAHYFAKLGFNYEDSEACNSAHKLAESLQYYLLKASNKLAIEKGVCDGFLETKYSKGILPIDTYKKDIDEFCSEPLHHDWESLRSDIVNYGLRHTTLTAAMPGETCLFWGHKVKTIDGYMDFHEIAEKGGLDWRSIESNDQIGWYDLSNPIQVETLDGYKEIDKIYFNGNKEVVSIEFENGKIIKCTPNHRFLVKDEDGNSVWKRVYELEENDDVVEF